MILGSCCCGGVQFRLTEVPKLMGTCHCTRCRMLGISTIAFVSREHFEWLQGRDLVELYHPEPPYKYTRGFCRRCGTALGEVSSDAESFPVNVHCLEDHPSLVNGFHEFVGEKPAWYVIGDDAPQFSAHPLANASAPPVDSSPVAGASSGQAAPPGSGSDESRGD